MMPLDLRPLLPRARGVDISAVQQRCDFATLAAGGFDFVIPKATEGLWVDKTFGAHIEGARAAGLLVPCVYHVLDVDPPVGAQAKNALQAATAHDVSIIALDFELGSPRDAIRALEFADEILYRGKRVIVYSYPNFMRRLAGTVSLALLAQKTDYWGADYLNEKEEPLPSQAPWTPPVWGPRWRFWQWSGNNSTHAPGIPQPVDHNLYNGTRLELEEWMNPTATAGSTGKPATTGAC